jgi:hypothetical protein
MTKSTAWMAPLLLAATAAFQAAAQTAPPQDVPFACRLPAIPCQPKLEVCG